MFQWCDLHPVIEVGHNIRKTNFVSAELHFFTCLVCVEETRLLTRLYFWKAASICCFPVVMSTFHPAIYHHSSVSHQILQLKMGIIKNSF